MWRILQILAAWCLVGVVAEPGKSVMGELFWCNTLCMCRAKTQVEVQCFDRKQLYNLLGFSERTVRKLEQNKWEMESQVHWCNDLCLCYTRTNAEFRCVRENYLVQFITDTVGDRYFLYNEEPKEETQLVEEERPVEEGSPVEEEPVEEEKPVEEESPVEEEPGEEDVLVEEDVPVEEESSTEPLETERPLEEGQPVGGEGPVEEERPVKPEQIVEREQPPEEEHSMEELQTEEAETEKMELTKRSERKKNKKNRKSKKVQRKKDPSPPVEEDVTVFTSETTMVGGEPEPTTMEHGLAPLDPAIPLATTTEHRSAPDPTVPPSTTTPSLPTLISAHQSEPAMEEEAELLPKQEAVAASPAVTAMQPPTRRQPFPTMAAATTAAPQTPHTTTREEPTIPPKVSPVLEVPMGRKTVASEVSQDLDELSSAVMQIKSDVVLNQRILLVTVAAAGIAMLGVLILAVHGCSRRRHPPSDAKKKREGGAKEDNHVTKVNLEEAW